MGAQHSLMFVFALATISTLTCCCWAISYPFYFLFGMLGLSSKAPRSEQIGSRLHKLGAQCLLWLCGVKVFVGKSSREKLEKFKNKNVVYVFNHSTNLDPFIMTTGLPANCRFIHKRELSFVPLLGQALYCSGHISINRGDRSKAVNSLKHAEEFLTQPVDVGGSICIAPEGTRTRDGKLILPFKKGPFHIAKNTGAVLVPVVVRGGFPIFPPGSMSLKPNVVSIRILDEIDPKKYNDDVDAMREALEKVFVENVKDENWKEGDTAPESERPISANPLFPVFVAGVVYKLVGLGLGIWNLMMNSNPQ